MMGPRMSNEKCKACGWPLAKINTNPDRLCAMCQRTLAPHQGGERYRKWVAEGRPQWWKRCPECRVATAGDLLPNPLNPSKRCCLACVISHRKNAARASKAAATRRARNGKPAEAPAPVEPEQVSLPGVPEGVPEGMNLATLKAYANAYIVRYASERAELERRAEAIGCKLVKLGVDE